MKTKGKRKKNYSIGSVVFLECESVLIISWVFSIVVMKGFGGADADDFCHGESP